MAKKRCFCNFKYGFTLIELLVVISIIAVLMAIMMPALRKARQQAQGTICLSALRHWGQIFTMYNNDYNGSYHHGHHAGSQGTWMESLRKYYSDLDEFRTCPTATRTWYLSRDGKEVPGPGANKGTYTAWGVFTGKAWHPEGSYGSYGMNGWLTNPITLPEGNPGTSFWRNINRIHNPSNTPLAMDALWVDIWAEPTTPYHPGPQEEVNPEANWWRRHYVQRHNGTNIVTVDGAAERISLKDMWFYEWHRNYKSAMSSRSVPEWPDWIK